jgi:exonuclease SbcC
MIPTRLTLKNFLSYEALDLDLSSLHAACVAGVNGSGKSALVDAILFALYGKGRCKSLDAYVRLGATDMAVTLEFQVGHGLYRVIRRRSTLSRGKTEIDFQRGEDGREWVGIASGEAANEAMVSVIGLDHEALLASAVCRQGDASRLTDATAGERKDILRRVFRLALYETWWGLAGKESATLTGSLSTLDDEVQLLQATVADRDQVQAALADSSQLIERLAQEVTTTTERLTTVREDLVRLDADQQQRAKVSGELTTLSSMVKGLQADLATASTSLEKARADLADKPHLEAQQREIEQLDAQITGAQRDVTEAALVLQHATERVATCTTGMQQLERQLQEVDRKTSDWKAKQALADEIRSAVTEVERLTVQKRELTEALNDRRTERVQLATSLADLKAVNAEIASIEIRLTLIRKNLEGKIEARNKTRSDRSGRAAVIETVPCLGVVNNGVLIGQTCPLLQDAHSARISLDELQHDIEALKAKLLDPDPALRKQLDAVIKQRNEYSTEEQLAAELSLVDRRINDAKANLTACEVTLASVLPIAGELGSLELADKELAELDERGGLLAIELNGSREYYAGAQDAKAEVERRHHEAITILSPLTAKRAEFQADVGIRLDALDTLSLQLPDLDRREATLRADLRAAEERVIILQADLARFGDLDARSATLSTSRREQEAAMRETEGQLGAARARHATAQTRLIQIDTACARLTSITPDLERLRQRRTRTDRLAGAYRTIPVLILENVIPALEAEANAILGRIGSSGLHVTLQTQRALKAKDTLAETLDILVRDRAGERPIENFSGGERFRVDFALRVALAKLIAQRSGVELKTLVVDEGFGALDPEGLALLLEAIQRIKEDFGLILVISHLDTVLEGFASRIMVTKDGSGSHVEVTA